MRLRPPTQKMSPVVSVQAGGAYCQSEKPNDDFKLAKYGLPKIMCP